MVYDNRGTSLGAQTTSFRSIVNWERVKGRYATPREARGRMGAVDQPQQIQNVLRQSSCDMCLLEGMGRL